MRSARDKAVYLPSNIEYLARNNGVEGGGEEALRLLVASPWVRFLCNHCGKIADVSFLAGVWCWVLPCVSIPCAGTF